MQATTVRTVLSPSLSLNSSLVPFSVGTVLLAAALLKAAFISASIGNPGGTLEQALLINLELLLAAVCFWGGVPKTTRKVLLVVFGGFAVYSFFLLAANAESCGCFGTVMIPPGWTLALDCVVLTLLFCWRPDAMTPIKARPGRPVHQFGILFFLTAVPAWVWMIASWPTSVSGEEDLASVGGTMHLQTDNWPGKVFPLVEQVDIGHQLRRGSWLVVLFHHDCVKCRETIPGYLAYAAELKTYGSMKRMALVEIPPYGQRTHKSLHDSSVMVGKLSDNHDWVVQTPCEIMLENGVVVSTSTEMKVLEEMDETTFLSAY